MSYRKLNLCSLSSELCPTSTSILFPTRSFFFNCFIILTLTIPFSPCFSLLPLHSCHYTLLPPTCFLMFTLCYNFVFSLGLVKKNVCKLLLSSACLLPAFGFYRFMTVLPWRYTRVITELFAAFFTAIGRRASCQFMARVCNLYSLNRQFCPQAS